MGYFGYFVVLTLSGAKNLYGDSWRLIKNKILSSIGKKIEALKLSNKELQVVKIYSLFMLAGTIISISTFTFYGIPILNEILVESINKIMLFGTTDFVQGIILFILTSIQIGGLLFYIIGGIWRIVK